MKRFIFILPMILFLSMTSCKDRVAGDTDHEIKIEDNEVDSMQNPATATRNGDMKNQSEETNVTSSQLDQMHKDLNMTPEQLQRLKDMRNNRSDSLTTYTTEEDMDRDYKTVLNEDQYSNYQKWKSGNLKAGTFDH